MIISQLRTLSSSASITTSGAVLPIQMSWTASLASPLSARRNLHRFSESLNWQIVVDSSYALSKCSHLIHSPLKKGSSRGVDKKLAAAVRSELMT